MMIETLALLVSLGGLPIPQFEARLPAPQFDGRLPVPRFDAIVPVTRADPFAEPAEPTDPATVRDFRGRLVRLPGPRNHFVCPECQRTDDWMYLGDHLRRKHGKSMKEIGAIKYWELGVWHDNLHNLNWKPGATTETAAPPSDCEDGSCNVGPIRRLLGRWR